MTEHPAPRPTTTAAGTTELDVGRLRQLVGEMRARIAAERAARPPALHDLQSAIARAQAQVEEAEAALARAKALAKKRKREIDEWKAWYNSLPEAEKATRLATLQSEIDWRAAELNDLTLQIGELSMEQAGAVGQMEQAKQRLAAFEAGVHTRPIDEDPRLVSLQQALAAATAAVERTSDTGPKTGSGQLFEQR